MVKAQDRKPFHIIPLVPVAGQDVKFTYDNSLTSLADEETILRNGLLLGKFALEGGRFEVGEE